jgi:spore coat polysaccharide biosynthesis protein SpsF
MGESVGIISQVRMTSTRLPGKVLLPAAGKPMLAHHINRLHWAGVPAYLATTTNATDDAIVDFAEKESIPVYRGDEHDVLGRFAGLVMQYGLEIVVRVTSDCPLIDGHEIAKGLDAFLLAKDTAGLYLSNTLMRTEPRGFDYEIFWAQDLLRSTKDATLSGDREHVTPYLRENRSGKQTLQAFSSVAVARGASQFRLTLDEADDYTLLRTLIEDYGAANMRATDIIALMEQHPELAAINAHVAQKTH